MDIIHSFEIYEKTEKIIDGDELENLLEEPFSYQDYVLSEVASNKIVIIYDDSFFKREDIVKLIDQLPV